MAAQQAVHASSDAQDVAAPEWVAAHATCRKKEGGARHIGRSEAREHRAREPKPKGKAGHRRRHDWGTAKLTTPLEHHEPALKQPRSSVSANDVPDSLRARIKAMLAQSSAAS